MASNDAFFGVGNTLGGTTFSGSSTGSFSPTTSFSGSATAPVSYSNTPSLPTFASGQTGFSNPSLGSSFSLDGATLGSGDYTSYVGGDQATAAAASGGVAGGGGSALASLATGAAGGDLSGLSGLASLFGSGAGSGGAGGGGGVSFLDNPLNGYAQIAYHFRLFSTGDTEGGKEIVIAETGVTGFNIRSVHMNSFVGPNSQTHNTQMTDFTMTVVESMGIAFLDGLMVAATQGNVKNVQKAFYWLELSFRGYKETGEIVSPITEGMPNGGKVKWKIVLKNIDTELKSSGAEYTIQGMMIHDAVLEPSWLGVQSNITLKAKTVQEFFDSLSQQLNKDVVRLNGAQLIEYKFQFHGNGNDPNPSSYKIEGGTPAVDTYRMLAMSEGNRDVWTANIPRGTQINKLVEDIIGVTKEGQALAMHGKPGGDTTALPKGEFRDTVSFRVYPQVKYAGKGGEGEYSEVFGQYHKQVTFHVKPFRTQGTVIDAKEVSQQSSQQAAWSAVQAQTKKKYEYIFTGLNTEVINFDIKFNTAWAATLPRLAGWDYMNEMVEHAARFDKQGDEKLKQFRQAQGQAAQGQGMINNGANTLASSAGSILSATTGNALGASIQNAFNTVTGTPGTAAQNATGGLTGIINQGIAGATQIGQGQALQNSAEVQMREARAALEKQAQSQGLTNASSGTYVEDLLGQASGAAVFTQMSLTQQAESARRANGTGMMAQRGTIGRSVYGAMLDQLYDNRMFQIIDLTVRGDPYWLGGNYDAIFSDGAADAASADFTKGDTCFALCFKYPYGVHEETGQPNLRPQNAYNGAYRALKITHDFADGKFTQTINAMRMAKIPAETINQAVSQASGASTSAAAGASNVQATTGLTSNTTTATSTPNASVTPVPASGTFGVSGPVGTTTAIPTLTVSTPTTSLFTANPPSF